MLRSSGIAHGPTIKINHTCSTVICTAWGEKLLFSEIWFGEKRHVVRHCLQLDQMLSCFLTTKCIIHVLEEKNGRNRGRKSNEGKKRKKKIHHARD